MKGIEHPRALLLGNSYGGVADLQFRRTVGGWDDVLRLEPLERIGSSLRGPPVNAVK